MSKVEEIAEVTALTLRKPWVWLVGFTLSLVLVACSSDNQGNVAGTGFVKTMKVATIEGVDIYRVVTPEGVCYLMLGPRGLAVTPLVPPADIPSPVK